MLSANPTVEAAAATPMSRFTAAAAATTDGIGCSCRTTWAHTRIMPIMAANDCRQMDAEFSPAS